MIVWLASYPRSGNTLTRQIFRQVFGQITHSQYNDRMDIAAVKKLAEAVGHVSYSGEWKDFYRMARESKRLYLVKTHHPPMDEGRAIYIVRDGRAAAVSWWHVLKDLRGRTDVSLDDVIEGRKVAYGTWSGHLESWQPLTRPDTLLLKFEDLARDPTEAIDRIAAFVPLQKQKGFVNELDHLRGLLPGFFMKGSTEDNVRELTPAQLARFDELHGAWLRRLGYRSPLAG